jgi:translocation and assembly module TamB
MPRRRAGLIGRGLGWTLAALLFPAAIAAALWWLLATEAGLRAASALAQGISAGALVIEDPQGSLAGNLQLGRVELRGDGFAADIHSVKLDWNPRALLHARLEIALLAVERVDFAAAPDDEPATPPQRLSVPFALELAELRIGSVHKSAWPLANGEFPAAPAAPLLRDLTARLASDGRVHHIDALAFATEWARGQVRGSVAGSAPFALDLEGRFEGTQPGREFALDVTLQHSLLAPRLTLVGDGAGLSGRGWLDAAPFAPVPLTEAHLEVDEFDPATLDPSLPSAALAAKLDLDSRATPGRADGSVAPADWVLQGLVSLRNGKPAPLDAGGLPLASVAGQLEWRAGRLQLQGLILALAGGGRLSGQLDWQPPGEVAAQPGFGRVSGGFEVNALNLRALDSRLLATRLAGTLAGEAGAEAQQVDLMLAGPELSLALAARHAQGVVELKRAELAAAGGRLSGSGTLELGGSRAGRFEGRLENFDPHALYADAPRGRLNLALSASGQLADGPQGALEFKLDSSRLAGQPLTGQGKLAYRPQRLEVSALRLEMAGNRLEAAGVLGEPGAQLEARVDAPRLDALGEGFAGRAALHATLGGSLAEPQGELTAFAERLHLPGSVRVSGMNAYGRLDAGASGALLLSIGASGIGPQSAEYDWMDSAALQLSGTRAAHAVELHLARGRRDRLQARLQGGLADGAWQGRLAEVKGEGDFNLTLAAPADLKVGAGGLELGATRLETAAGWIELAETRLSAAETVLRGAMHGLGFGLVATEGRPMRRGQPTLRLGGEWDLRFAEHASGRARLFRESGDLILIGDTAVRLGLQEFEAILAAVDDRLALSVHAQGSQLGELAGAVTALAERGPQGWRIAPDGALIGSAHVEMPSIAWLGPLLEPGTVAEGALRADFSFSGTPAAPVAVGSLRGSGLGLAMGELGLRLSGGTLEAAFDRDRLQLKKLDFVSPNAVQPADSRVPVAALTATPGTLSVGGEVALATGEGRFSFAARRLPILQRPDRWLVASGEGEARTGWNSIDLTARLKADAGFLGLPDRPAPSLSSDVVVLGRRGQEVVRTPLDFTADVSVDLGDQLYLSALGVDTRLAGRLRLTAREGRPLAATGTLNTVGGLYEAYGYKLSIERGLVNFVGPLNDPTLAIVALRKGLEVEAGVSITGSARRPSVQLVSQPAVPDAEKLSWIVLGHAPDAGGGADLALLLPAAQALLGGPGGGMTKELASGLGIDELSFGQGDLNSVGRGATSSVVGSGSAVTRSGTVSGQVLTLGKRLSGELFLSFEQSLAGAESIVKLTYQLTRRLAVIARGGTDNAVDISYTLSYQ